MFKFNFYLFYSGFFLLLSFLTLFFCLNLILYDYCIFLEWSIFCLNSYNYVYLLFFDWVSLLFVSLVLFISSMVIFYSIDYMGTSNYSSNRFLYLVVLFVLSMLMMILSPNLLSILLGWDGLGLVSYLLVIYFNSVKSYLAGMLTCLINRLGDIGLLISISWLVSFGSWHFIFYLNYYSHLIFYLIIISSFTKSAQIPFSVWLPAAMAAPTPVSSLVHSSTLVTAGVYLLIRFFNSLIYGNFYFLFLSLMTMFMSSFCANYEFDLKKIIALSTLSQLGLMMSSLFLGLVNLSFFHLLSHAMFKSLLFLCSGIFIYYMNDNQDIRCVGSISNFMPYTTASFNIANMALCGVPFLSGFYSKDLIVEVSIFSSINFFVYFFFYLCLGLTSCYSIRLFYYSMLFYNNSGCLTLFYEEKNYMKMGIIFLTLFSVFFGCLVLWFILIDFVYLLIPMCMKLMTILFVFMGVFIGLQLFEFSINFFLVNYYFFTNMWFIYSYSYFLYYSIFNFSYKYSMLLNWGEYYGGMGLSFYLLKMSNLFQCYSMSNIKVMFLSFFIWLLFLI
nr:NADH dehydrogenase subunit 5 [Dikraneurini sp. SL-2021a]